MKIRPARGEWWCRALMVVVFALMMVGAKQGEAQAQLLDESSEITTWKGTESGLVYYYPRRFEPAVRRLEQRAEPLLSSLELRLGIGGLSDIEVWLLPDLEDFFTLKGLEYRPARWAVGLSLTDRSTILVKHGASAGGTIVDIEATFSHELAHVAIDRARGGEPVPRWFNEGFSVLHAEQWSAERSEVLSRAASTGNLIAFSALSRSFPAHHQTVSLAYSQSFHFVRWIQQRHGERVFADTLAGVREGVAFEGALEEVTGEDLQEMEARWRGELEDSSHFLAILRDETGFLFGAAMLLLVAFGIVKFRRRRQKNMMEADEADSGWDYDPADYPLPGQTTPRG